MTSPNYTANVVLQGDVSAYNRSMAEAATQTNKTTQSVNALVKSYDKLKNFAKTRINIIDKEAVATITASVAAAALFEKQLSQLDATSKVTGGSLKEVKAGIENTFLSLPVSRTEVVNLANALSQMGVAADKTMGPLLMNFEKLGAAVGGNAQSLASSMTSFTKAFGDSSIGNIKVMSNSLVDLSQNAHTSAQGVVDFANSIAPIARVAGITQNQTLGLATAFSKAGADGYVAANTFNRMLQDITQLASSGSPELTKYANVLGLTVQQFNALPRAQAVAELFTTINRQGSQGISTLNQLGIDGVRSITALQSVVSQGDISKLAQGGSTTGNQLEEGAKASFSGLADELAKTRNEFTQYGTYIGTAFLTPMTKAVEAVNSLVHSMGLLKPAATPFLAAISTVSGVAGPLLGLAAPLVAARFLRNNRTVQSFARGFGAGRRDGPGNEAALARFVTSRGRTPADFDMKNMTAVQRGLFTAGAGASTYVPAVGATGGVVTNGVSAARQFGYNMLRAPFIGARTYFNWQRDYYNDSRERQGAGPGRVGANAGNLGQTVATNARGFFGGIRQGFAQGGSVAAVQAAAAQSSTAAAAAMTRFSAAWGKASTDATTGLGVVGKEAYSTGRSLGLLAGAAVRASGSALGGAVATVAKPVASGIGTVGMGAMNWLRGNPMMASMLAIPLVLGAVSKIRKGDEENYKAFDEGINPIQKYNEQLGIASKNLADFSSAAKKFTDNTAYTTTNSNFNTAAKVSQADLAARPDKPSIEGFKVAGQSAAGDRMALAQQIINSLPITDAKQVGSLKGDLLASGFSQGEVNTLVGGFAKGAPGPKGIGVSTSMDYGALASKIYGLQAQGGGPLGLFDTRVSKTGTELSVGVLSGIQTGAKNASEQVNPAYGAQLGLAQNLAFNAGLVNEVGDNTSKDYNLLTNDPSNNYRARGLDDKRDFTIEQLSRNLAAITGDKDDQKNLQDELYKKFDEYGGFNKVGAMDTAKQQQLLIDVLNSTDSGKNYLSNFGSGGLNGTTVDPTKFAPTLDKLLTQGNDDFNKLLRTYGPIGEAVAGNPGTVKYGQGGTSKYTSGAVAPNADIQQVISLGQTANAGQVTKATNETLAIAGISKQQQLTSGMTTQVTATDQSIASLKRFIAQIGDTSNPMSQLAQGALSTAQALRQVQTAGLSRQGQLQSAGTNYFNAAALNTTNPTEATAADQANAQAGFDQQVEQQRQYAIGVYTAVRDWTTSTERTYADFYKSQGRASAAFNLSMAQGEQDMYLQRQRQERDFAIQMAQSQDDFNLQRKRTARDFAISMAQTAADMNKQIARQTRDFNISMARQAKQAAETIYSPYERIQSKMTTTSGTVLANLRDQTQALQQQMDNLKKLQALGLSQDSIDTLGLADAANAQQLSSMVGSLASDPSLISAINDEVQKRMKATTALTQSSFNETFRNSVEDFKKGMNDSAQDYKTSVQRAVEGQSRAYNDMVQSFNISVQRANEAEQRGLSDMMQSYNISRQRAAQQQSIALGQQAADLSTMMARSRADLNTQFTEISGNYMQIMAQAMGAMNGKFAQYAPAIAAVMKGNFTKASDYILALHRMLKNLEDPNPQGFAMNTAERNKLYGGNAEGTDSFRGGMSWVGERGPELISVPKGAQIHNNANSNSIALSLAQMARTSEHRAPSGGNGGTQVYQDNSTTYSGNITVVAQDTKAFEKALQAKRTLKSLSRPQVMV